MSRDLRAALDRQANMEERRRQFSSAVTHDLRTSLSAAPVLKRLCF